MSQATVAATIGRMTPDDLMAVRRSWTELRRRRTQFIQRLEATIASTTEPASAGEHARQLVEAADELVDLLATPSELAAQARAIVAAWPAAVALPRLDVDGVAWRHAAAAACPDWSDADDAAWRRAWLLLGDVLAEDSLAPFDGPPAGRVVPTSPPT